MFLGLKAGFKCSTFPKSISSSVTMKQFSMSSMSSLLYQSLSPLLLTLTSRIKCLLLPLLSFLFSFTYSPHQSLSLPHSPFLHPYFLLNLTSLFGVKCYAKTYISTCKPCEKTLRPMYAPWKVRTLDSRGHSLVLGFHKHKALSLGTGEWN